MKPTGKRISESMLWFKGGDGIYHLHRARSENKGLPTWWAESSAACWAPMPTNRIFEMVPSTAEFCHRCRRMKGYVAP